MGRHLFRRHAAADGRSREDASRRAIAELTASRRAIAEAYEVERRRIERDLHDGTQQHLVAALMRLGEAQLSPALASDPDLSDLVAGAKAAVTDALTSLRTTVRGLNPRTLVDLGLEAAVRDLAATNAGRVTLTCPHPLPTLPESVMAAAYFLASEAITNTVKHAPAASVSVLLAADRHLHLSIVDDGPGGARFVDGHGLTGMRERLAAFGGTLELSSPPGGPTHVSAHIPLLLDPGQSAIPRTHPAAPDPGTRPVSPEGPTP